VTAVASLSFAIVLVSALWAAYTFLVYPSGVWLLARLRQSRPPPPAAPDFVPRVALVISAHNEEAVIRAKLDNALALDYPPERLAVWVSSDGSTDRTCAIAREFRGADQRVRLVAYAVGVSPSDICRYAHGEETPAEDVSKRLRDLYTATWFIASTDGPGSAHDWLTLPNPKLDDRAPAELLREGESPEPVWFAAAPAF
jgi:hypothetical protein